MQVEKTHFYKFADFRLDPERRVLADSDDRQIPLMPKAFETLLYLIENRGRVIEKDELMREIWPDTIVEENNLSQNISVLRRTLGEKRGQHRFIATVPGRGFKFVAEVHEVTEGAVPDFAADADARPTAAGHSSTRIILLAVAAAFVVVIVIGYAGYRLIGREKVGAPKSVAILPFKPLVPQHRDEVLEMGMSDTLIARLSGIPETIVRPLASVRSFGGIEQDPLAAGRELGVDTVLDGNIQRWGDKVRVNARLLDVNSGSSIWAGTFDEQFTDIFAVQDAIAKKVAESLRLSLGSEDARPALRGTRNIEAYGYYAQGRYHALKLTPAEIRKGIGLFQQAIDADPMYALAYAGLAEAYRTLPITSDVPSGDALPQARSAAQKALEIDPQLGEAHVVLGWVAAWYDRDWVRSEEEFLKAIKSGPNNSEAHRGYAHLLTVMGRHDDAVREISRARELDPLSLIINALEGQTLFYAGRNEEAIDRLKRTLDIERNFWVAHINLAKIYIEQRKYDQAMDELREAEEFSGGNSEVPSLMAYTLCKANRRDEALVLDAKLAAAAEKQYVPPYNLAMIQNGLGNADAALGLLERAYDEHDVRISLFKIDPKWNDLRREPRFSALMSRMNLN